MNAFEIILLLVITPVGLIGAGYGLAAPLREMAAVERLAVAMLAGLGVLLWTVSVVNLVLPLAGTWGWVCVAPVAFTLLRTNLCGGLVRDLIVTVGTRRGAVVAVATAGFLGFLLWPLLSRPDVVFYDGTSSHDGFFWVVGAEHLKRQTYLQTPVAGAAMPLYYSVEAITGWKPAWGRMGAEGLLALLSSLIGVSPLKLYVAASATLFLPWLAAVFLVMRTFLFERFNLWAALALVTLQPAFVFFHANANLPNLVGMLIGALAVIAIGRAMAEPNARRPWLVLLALSVHGLLCSYPEILPAIALPCALLWIRGWVRSRAERTAAPVLAPVMAVGAGLLLNPASTMRAACGFSTSLALARVPDHWANIFHAVTMPARLPAMATLSVPFGDDLGPVGGGLVGVVIVVLAAWAVVRARDRFGAIAMLAGAGGMLAYTLLSHVAYGWQKTAQFSAVFTAALVPVPAIGVLAAGRDWPGWRRRTRQWLAVGATAIFGYALVANVLAAHKWAGQKFLTQDWFAARAFSRQELRNAPVLIDAATFSQPFFYTMWATYFLTDSRVYFTGPDPRSGGYLQAAVARDAPLREPAPQAILVSGTWARAAAGRPGWRSGTVALLAADGHRR